MARVLIVDDKAEIRLLLKTAVEREGHSALLAADAEQAWGLLAEDPEVLVADIRLPGESGLELSTRVRHQPRFSKIPVVFVTAMVNAPDRLRGCIEEPVAVLEKPFRFAQVARAMRDVLRH